MKEKIYDARTGMEYVLVGDYYLPALKLPRTRPIGRWGMLHKAYLKLRKPAYYQSLLLSGKLDTVLANVEEQAAERYKVLIEQMSQREETSEKLKEENQMEWVRRMNNLENRAAEIGYQSSTVLDEPEREAGTTSIPIPQREESENIPLPDLPGQLENVQQSGNEIAERGMPT